MSECVCTYVYYKPRLCCVTVYFDESSFNVRVNMCDVLLKMLILPGNVRNVHDAMLQQLLKEMSYFL